MSSVALLQPGGGGGMLGGGEMMSSGMLGTPGKATGGPTQSGGIQMSARASVVTSAHSVAMGTNFRTSNISTSLRTRAMNASSALRRAASAGVVWRATAVAA